MIHETPQQRRRRQRFDALLDAGLELVSEAGLDGLTIARLAKRMDWTKGAMYRYVRSKDQLLAAMNARVLTRLGETSDAVLAEVSEPDERIRALLGLLIDFSERDPAAFGLVAVTLADPRQLVADKDDAVHLPVLRSLIGRVVEALDVATVRGVLAPGDSEERAMVIVFGAVGVLQTRKLSRFESPSYSASALARAHTEALLEAWRPA